MNKLSKILCLLLSLLLLTQAPLLALAEDMDDTAEETEAEFPEELIVGHPTVTKGDFFTELFGNDTADIDVRALIHGYNLVNWDQNQGTYVFDPSVVESIGPVEVDADGNHTYKMILCDNLYYSDGTKITAWDYAFSILLMMSPEVEAIGGKIYRAEHLMGYDDYIATRKKIMNGEELTDKDVRSLIGVEVHYNPDDKENARELWFNLDHEFLPYFFETGLMLTVPYPISVIAPGCVVDDVGYGIFLRNEDESIEEPIFTPELLKKTILDPETGYNSHPSVVSGPYTLVSWDAETGEGHYQINPYFKGAWLHNNLPGENYSGGANYIRDMDIDNETPRLDASGNEIWLVKPTIEKIKFVVADNDTLIQQLADGELHLVNKVTYGPTIVEGMQKGIKYQNYPRIGLSFLTFTYDWPTVHDKEVRQAIAWCMDRDLLGSRYCGVPEAGQFFNFRMDGYYGFEQWEYMLLDGRLSYPVNFLDQVTLPQVQVDENGEPIEDLTKKYKNRYVETQEDYEKAIAAWEALADEWEDKLVAYTVNLSKAERLLADAGWTLNRNGEEFQPGVDDVRCKEMEDGSIVALDLKLMYPEGNHMKELMETAVRNETDRPPEGVEPDADAGSFVENLARVGIKLELVPAPMEELLKSYYRQTKRTTDMIYLATNFHVIVDPSITYSTDTTKNHEIWNNTYSDDEELWIDAKAMRRTEPGDIFEYVSKWVTFQERYNEVLPTIPIYSNIYYDFYNEYLQNYNITGQVTWSQAILPAYFALENLETAAEEEEAEDGDFESFD